MKNTLSLFLIAFLFLQNFTTDAQSGMALSLDDALSGGATTVAVNAPMVYQESIVVSTSIPVGKGESDERVIAVNVVAQGDSNPLELTNIQFNLSGTTSLLDVENIKIYYTGESPRMSTAVLFGTASVGEGPLEVDGSQLLAEGANHFWITADLSENAQEGNVLKGEIASVTVDGQAHAVIPAGAEDGRLIILEHKLLYSGGDYGSVNYRIPAIETAADNSLIVAADARVDQPGDLPNNIDIVVRRSTDMGDTWSESLVIADFGQAGGSDPALVLDRRTGDLLCLFASHVGLFQSTPNNRIRFQVCRSQDNGQTWSAPQEFTDQIYNPSWSAAWLASGSAHQLRSGRIVGAVGVRETSANAISNFMIFSDDGGQSWGYLPNPASSIGDEAKIVGLDNGNIMMNIRNQTPDRRRIVISEDGGQSWSTPYFQEELIDPFVNGDLIRYTSVLDGFDKSRLLFSIAAHPTSRQNLTIFLSYDEGATWPVSKVINPGPSGYSSLTVLGDGTIGCFYENGEYEGYQLYFARVSLDWLTDGADSYTMPTADAERPVEDFQVEILPNPADSLFQLVFDLKEKMAIRATLLNEDGLAIKNIIDEKLSAGRHALAIDVSTLPSGAYFITMEVNGILTARKVLVLR